MTTTDDVVALLPGTLTIGREGWLDSAGDPLPHVSAAVIVYSADSPMIGRRLDGAAYGLTSSWSLVCVSNNGTGASILSGLVAAALDGKRAGGAPLRVTGYGPVIEDRGDPSTYRWSRTVTASVDTAWRP